LFLFVIASPSSRRAKQSQQCFKLAPFALLNILSI
jgi:hypothetical protein